MNTPDVSIVIIFFNAAGYLEEAIASVRAQAGVSWELVLVDDGSTDASGDIARRHADGSVRVVTNATNLGMSAARNIGMRASRGRYVFFLDADDVLLPGAIARLAGILDQQPDAAAAYGPIEWWYGDARDSVEPRAVASPRTIAPSRLLISFLAGTIPVPSALIVRREAIDRAGGFVEASRGLYEDQVFLVKLLLRERIFVSTETYYRYRQHDDASTAVAATRDYSSAERRRFHAWTAAHLRAQRVRHPLVWAALLRAQLPYRLPRLYGLLRAAKGSLRGAAAC